MSQTAAFIARVTNDHIFGAGERARVRNLSGRGLEKDMDGFDLFTGLWWPLREKNKAAPRRTVAWLIVKLYAAFPIPQSRCGLGENAALAAILGREEHRFSDENSSKRFRQRFNRLLVAPMLGLESHLRWALAVVNKSVIAGHSSGIDWAQLTDDLSLWNSGKEHSRKRDIRDIWAEQYLSLSDHLSKKEELSC